MHSAIQQLDDGPESGCDSRNVKSVWDGSPVVFVRQVILIGGCKRTLNPAGHEKGAERGLH